MKYVVSLKTLRAFARCESDNMLQSFCLSHHPLRLLFLRVNYIQLKRTNNNFHGLKIKTKRILGLKIEQIQVQIILTRA